MSTLKELIETQSQIEQKLVESGGEITPELEALITCTEKELQTKVDSYVGLIERLDDIEAFYKDRAEMYSRISKGIKGSIKFLKDRILTSMDALGVAELSGDEFYFKKQRSAPSLSIDESKIPDQFLIQEVVTSVDKDSVREALKAGEIVPGAFLASNEHVRAYPKKK